MEGFKHEFVSKMGKAQLVNWISKQMNTILDISSADQFREVVESHHSDVVVVAGNLPSRSSADGEGAAEEDSKQQQPNRLEKSEYVSVSRTTDPNHKALFCCTNSAEVGAHIANVFGAALPEGSAFLAVLNPHRRESDVATWEGTGTLYTTGNYTRSSLEKTLKAHRLPLITELNEQVLPVIFSDGEHLLLLVFKTADPLAAAVKTDLAAVARRYREQFHLVLVDFASVYGRRLHSE
eukprot:GHVU01131346.1.p1 GENE.GHVU01131346.1~~GHVU01131346.1.p1  ORF type:complete len:237 (-),score=54.79 GHVU01131346.1:220-930(-)